MTPRTTVGTERAAANDEAVGRMVATRARLVGAATAGEVVPGLIGRRVHHAGPPIPYAQMCAPMRGALVAAALIEGWSRDAAGADQLLAGGGVDLAANNDHRTVGPMSGPVSTTTPVWIVEDAATGARAFSPFHEGFGRAQSMGSSSGETIDLIRRMASELVPVVNAALTAMGGIDMDELVAEAIVRGDELHNRCRAATSMLVDALVGGALEAGIAPSQVLAAREMLAGNSQTAATPAMAWAKLMLLNAEGVEGSSIVTAYARNGVTVGLKLSGMPERWFTADAPQVTGHYLEGYGPDDATPDLGDSAVVEVAGIGAFAMAASPAFSRVVGERVSDGIEHTLRMYAITHMESPRVLIPSLEWRGAPLGIDALRVVDSGVAPVHNTAIANRIPGAGTVGTGIVYGVIECYRQAVSALGPGR